MPSHFRIIGVSGQARAGVLTTPHGEVPTPCFMPIATVGAVRHVTATELRAIGATMVLANTYHLMLRPGTDHVAARGGLHRFMGWDGPILTDSGGFQVFSLGPRAARRGGHGFVERTGDGVRFRSHLDGSEHLLTPELAIDYQRDLGSDIAMVLDVCPPQPCAPDVLRDAVATTTAWAERAIDYHHSLIRTNRRMRGGGGEMQLFGIVQGGSDAELRKESAAAITALPFDGFAIGGVAVGEEKAAIRETIDMSVPLLPEDRPRYLMGLGTPDDLVHAVQRGVDLFDCVLPTRDARHGRVYRKMQNAECKMQNIDPWYETINIGNERWREDDRPIDPDCPCPACRHHSLAYLRHLHAIAEPLGARLLTLHNLTFYLNLMRTLRREVINGEK